MPMPNKLRIAIHQERHVAGAVALEKMLVDGDAVEKAEALLIALGHDIEIAERIAAHHVVGLDAGAGGTAADDAAVRQDRVKRLYAAVFS